MLKPGDLDHDASRNWRAQIGMAPSSQRASLDMSGHRALNHYKPKNSGPYSNVPPMYNDRRSDYNNSYRGK